MTKAESLAIARRYYRKIKSKGIPVKSVTIFGSQVKGKADSSSDIDLCVVADNFGKDRVREMVELILLRKDISDLIEPHPFSSKEIALGTDPLIREIKKTGIKVR